MQLAATMTSFLIVMILSNQPLIKLNQKKPLGHLAKKGLEFCRLFDEMSERHSYIRWSFEVFKAKVTTTKYVTKWPNWTVLNHNMGRVGRVDVFDTAFSDS